MSTRRLSYPGEIRISNEGCELDLVPRLKGYHIYRVLTDRNLTRRGYASRLLKRLCLFADKRGHVLTLEAGAFGHCNRSTPDIVKLYEKFGFRRRNKRPITEYDYVPMRREPCP